MDKNTDSIRLKNSFFIPLLLIVVIWFIKFLEIFFQADFGKWGLLPRNFNSLLNIFTSPLIHADWSHLFSNSLPIIVLTWIIFYFYRGIAYKILILSYLGSGLLLWILSNRHGYHIGMSGLIYAFAAFIFVSGLLRKYAKLIAISLIVAFLYGYLIWGVFPVDESISYEGHLSGAITGIVLAIIYRKHGPQKPTPTWELEDEENVEEDIINDIEENNFNINSKY